MRKSILLLAGLATLASCKKEGSYTIDGKVKGIEDGKQVFLERQDDSLGVVQVDTAKIANEEFKFQGVAVEPGLYSVRFNDINGKAFFIVEEGDIKLEIDKDSLFKSKMSGTYNNDQFREFNGKGLVIQRKIVAFKRDNQTKMMEAGQAQDTVTMKRIQGEYQTLMDQMREQAVAYIKEHPKAIVSALLVQSFFQEFEPDMKQIEELYNGLDPEVKKTKVGKKIAKTLKEMKVVDVGKKAPEFSAPNPEGQVVSLTQSLGKVTIIDFWASWCGPCRAENPNIVAIYNDFHDKGLNVISVSLDKPGAADKWKDAIAKDGMSWTQVSNLKEWEDPIAKMYSVTAIPKMFVLNEYGVVVAKDLRGDDLRKKIETLLSAPQAKS